MNKKSILPLIVIAVLLVLGVVLLLSRRRPALSVELLSAAAPTEPPVNPYRGWYQINGFMLSDDEFYDPATLATFFDLDVTTRLSLVEFNLMHYADRDLTDTARHQIRAVLDAADANGVDVIVRFLYDWDGNAAMTEPSDIAVVESHMRDTMQIVNEYADLVLVVQGLFVGNYGEMNGSGFLDDASLCTLAATLADVTDASVPLAVRTPAQWHTIMGTDTDAAAPAAGDTLAGRLGIYNDGMLGSANDLGTYPPDGRAAGQALIAQLATRIPYGGEVVIDNPYNDLPTAVTELAATRVSYLNPEYDAAVMTKWENSTYDGQNAYDYISSHMGYAYELAEADLTLPSGLAGLLSPTVRATLTVQNVGFAPAYRSFAVELVLSDGTAELAALPIDTDTRDWLPDSPATLSVTLPEQTLSDCFDGHETLTLSLRLRTADGEVIGFLDRATDNTLGVPVWRLRER